MRARGPRSGVLLGPRTLITAAAESPYEPVVKLHVTSGPPLHCIRAWYFVSGLSGSSGTSVGLPKASTSSVATGVPASLPSVSRASAGIPVGRAEPSSRVAG